MQRSRERISWHISSIPSKRERINHTLFWTATCFHTSIFKSIFSHPADIVSEVWYTLHWSANTKASFKISHTLWGHMHSMMVTPALWGHPRFTMWVPAWNCWDAHIDVGTCMELLGRPYCIMGTRMWTPAWQCEVIGDTFIAYWRYLTFL